MIEFFAALGSAGAAETFASGATEEASLPAAKVLAGASLDLGAPEVSPETAGFVATSLLFAAVAVSALGAAFALGVASVLGEPSAAWEASALGAASLFLDKATG